LENGAEAVKNRQPGSGLAAFAHTNPSASKLILTQMSIEKRRVYCPAE
jgi:hypothetical protein